MGAKRKATKASYGNKAQQMAAIASQGVAACQQPGFGDGWPMVKAKCNKLLTAAAQSGQLPIASQTTPATPAYDGVQQPLNAPPLPPSYQPAAQPYVDPNAYQSQYQQPAYGGASQYTQPYQDPSTGMVYQNAMDQNGNMDPNIAAQIQYDEQTASGYGGGGYGYGYAEGSGHDGVMHIVKMASPVIGLLSGLGIAFLVNKKVKDFGTKGLIGGVVVGTVLGVLVPVLMHKPHVKKAAPVAVAPTVAAPAAK